MKSRITLRRFIWSVVAISLIGLGAAFNASARLGNGTVGVFYDGMRCVMGFAPEKLGTSANIVNVVLIIALFFIGRRYINIGTILYIAQYGAFVSVGTYLYSLIFASDAMIIRIIASIIGSLILFAGIAIYVVADIGVDPTTAVVLVIRDKLKCEYKYAKWLSDALFIVIGGICGGKIGAVTIANLALSGPIIQWMIKKAQVLVEEPVK